MSDTKESIIGKQYIPYDNTASICLSTRNSAFLAGTFRPYVEPTVVTIISEPFDIQIFYSNAVLGTYKMILVSVDTNVIHSVLFNEKYIVNDEDDKVRIFKEHLQKSKMFYI